MARTTYLGLHTNHFSDKTRTIKNPFKDEIVTFHLDDGLSIEELNAIRRLFESVDASGPDDNGFWYIRYNDGSCIEVQMYGLDDTYPITTAVLNLNGPLTDENVGVVFKLASASGMLVTSGRDPATVAVIKGNEHYKLFQRWPETQIVHSVEELKAWIESKIRQGKITGDVAEELDRKEE